jgi:hypothetical protein
VARVKGFDLLSYRSARLCARGSLELHRHRVCASGARRCCHGHPRFMVVYDAFIDIGRLVSLGVLGMNRGLSLLSRGLHRLLRGKPASPRGGTLGLLHGSGLEESLDFITGPMGLEVRWLEHVTKEHGGCDHVMAGSTENQGLDRPILDDVMINVASSVSRAPPPCARSTCSCSRVR